MKNLPKIKIKQNIKEEVNLFIKFLHHPYYPQHKNLIFKAFPNLKLLLKQKNTEKKIIKNFISDFYKTQKNKINKIIRQSEFLIKQNGSPSLKTLSNLMDYRWNKSITYYAIPTILPFSPFKNNKFYFSILGEIYNKGNKNVLFIAVHEISHFIFYDILKKIESREKINLNEDSKNYLKEALTAALLNQKPLCRILKIKNYHGNPELHALTIQKSNGEIESFVIFLQKFYQTIKKEKKHFDIFIEKIIKIIKPIEKEFSKKRKIWNLYGNQLYKNPKNLSLYRKPIKINRGKR